MTNKQDSIELSIIKVKKKNQKVKKSQYLNNIRILKETKKSDDHKRKRQRYC